MRLSTREFAYRPARTTIATLWVTIERRVIPVLNVKQKRGGLITALWRSGQCRFQIFFEKSAAPASIDAGLATPAQQREQQVVDAGQHEAIGRPGSPSPAAAPVATGDPAWLG